MSAPRPWNLVAELSYRCPLRCAYCSNPLGYAQVGDGLDAPAWSRAFREAAELGVVHVGLTGGEPTLRADLALIVAGAAAAGLHSHLVTAGTTLDAPGLARLREAGLGSVQLSFQDSDAAAGDAVAGVPAHGRKLAFARDVRAQGLPLVLNVVLHRRNLARVPEIISLARELGALRLELANAQYHGWALANREALLPSRAQLERAAAEVERERRVPGGPEILFVLPDYFAGRPKPCMGGWGRRTIVVAPDGRVLPCHGAAELPGLEFGSLRERPLAWCWSEAPGMQAFRGEEWMREPCRSCPERARDFGGCRCQAFALTGDAASTDPACSLAPDHALVVAAREAAEAAAQGTEPPGDGDAAPPFRLRGDRRALAARALLWLLAAAIGCGGGEAGPAPTAPVERGRIERIVVATGTIEPENEVEVRPRIPGIVEAIHVKAGALVVAGQPLVEIERSLLVSQAQEAEAGLRSAQVEERYARIDLERVVELREGGASSEQARDAARARHERAQAEVARAEAALATLRTQLSYATVASPIAGRVLDVPVEVGSAVSPVTAVTGGSLLLSLAGTERLFLEGLVDENEVSLVALGQEARLRSEAFAQRSFAGRVAEIAPLGQRVQNVTYFEVKVEITDRDAQLLRPRMSGDADIVTEVVDGAILVPETALRYRGDRVYVEALADGRTDAEERDVEIGIVDGSRVQVLRGVAEGERVRVR